MKRTLIAIGAATVLLGTAAISQPGYGPGFGPGTNMMGGWGHGYGPGIGRMDGFGRGMGGPGMMGGYAYGHAPDLSAEQRASIAQAQQEFYSKQWPLMQQMHTIMWSANGGEGAFDEKAARQGYEAMAALQKQMFDNSIDMRKRVDAVLTPKQREQMRGTGPR